MCDLYGDVKTYRNKFPRNIICAHLNVNSVRSKFDELKFFLAKGYVDILALSETKLDSSDNVNLFNVNNYSLLRVDKRKNSGGLMLYISNRIPHRLVNVISTLPVNIEMISVELIFDKNDKWSLCHIYKNPSVGPDTFEKFFADTCNVCLSKYDNCIFIGDMNFNVLNPTCLLNDLCTSYGLENVITSPTCLKSQNPTLIDVMLVTDKRRFYNGFSYDVGISDFHNLIGAALRKHIPKKTVEHIEYRKVRDINYNAVRLDLSEYNLTDSVENLQDANSAFNFFHDSIVRTFDKHAPAKTKIRKNTDFPLMNKELQNAIRLRNQYRKKYYKHRTPLYHALYKEKRNNVTSIKRRLTRSYFIKKCALGTRNGNFWKTIKPFFNKSSIYSAEIMLRENENIITDELHLCEIFNDFFSRIGSDIGLPENTDRDLYDILDSYQTHNSVMRINQLTKGANSFSLREVNILDVKNAINKLNSRKASGFDTIPPIFIKTLKNDIAEHIKILINKCIRQNLFPDRLKMSNISPVYKKKDSLNKDNYRSINLLPIISKIFERVINDQLCTHMKSFFHTLLSGFRPKYGCKDILCKLTEDWRSALDNKLNIGVIAIDLSKAFDCMPHGLLLAKLHAYGIDISTCELLKSYLCERKQRVKIGTHYSSWVTASKGVPQGSILGPLLFNIFINDFLYMQLSSTVYNYADDNTISYIHEDISQIKIVLKSDAIKATEWFNDNMMKANPGKFQLMFLGKNVISKNVSLQLGDKRLTGSDTINVLGIDIDSRLNYDLQISNICGKMSKQINALLRIKNDLDISSRRAIYNSYIVPQLNYCATVWMFTSRTNLKKLDKLNNRAIRMVFDDNQSPCDDLLCRNKSLNVYKSCVRVLAIEMYKVKNNLLPNYIKELFTPSIQCYSLRDDNKYVLPKYKSKTYGYHCMTYIGSKLWGDIDPKIKNITSLKEFKHKITLWIDTLPNTCEMYL